MVRKRHLLTPSCLGCVVVDFMELQGEAASAAAEVMAASPGPHTGAAAPQPQLPMYMMPPHLMPPHFTTQSNSAAEDLPMHTSMRCVNNTGALILAHDVEKMQISGEWLQHAAKAGVLPAACAAADSEPGEAAAPMPPHAPREQPRASQDNAETLDIEALSNNGSVVVLCHVRHVVMG